MKRSIISRSSRFPFCWFGFNILSSKTSCFPNGRRKEEKDEDTESNGINRTWGGGIIKKKGGKLGGGQDCHYFSFRTRSIYMYVYTQIHLGVCVCPFRYVTFTCIQTHTHTHTRRERCTYVCVFCGGRVRVSLQRKFDTRAHLFIGCLLKNVATYLPKLVVSFFSSSPSPVFLFLANSPRERYTHFL